MDSKLKVSPNPIPELWEFLLPFRKHFYNVRSLGNVERYISGLLADIPRKTFAGIAEAVVGVSDEQLQGLLTDAKWDHEAFNQQRVEIMIERATAGDGVLDIDDSGIARKGNCCVGTERQYSGTLGKVDNCQVFVTSHYTDPYYSWPVKARLYLPESWCSAPERRKRAHIPDDVTFQTKIEIGLALIDRALEMGVPFIAVTSDGGYGDNPNFLDGLDERCLPDGSPLRYVVAVGCDFRVRKLDEIAQAEAEPVSPKAQGRGRPRKSVPAELRAPLRRADEVTVKVVDEEWHTITWRMGSEGPMTKQFTALWGRRAKRDENGPEGWLIGERPLPGHDGNTKWYWSNFPPDTPLARMVEIGHRRPVIERYYQDGKQETGLDDFMGQTWHGFHRHLVLEATVISWLRLQLPKPEQIQITIEPQVSEAGEQPVFPLRASTV
jgi:SRSO17 transposase